MVEISLKLLLKKTELIRKHEQGNGHRVNKHYPRVVNHQSFQGERVVCIASIYVTHSLRSWVSVKRQLEKSSQNKMDPAKHHKAEQQVI